jgi:leucyl aminopeptidase (aminopeptidase T)
MRPSLRTTPLLATIFAASLGFAQAPVPVVSRLSAQSAQRFHDIASLIVRQANLKPGQTIVISGAPDYLPVMEDLAVQATRAGAATIINVNPASLEAARRQPSGTRYGYNPPTQFEKDMTTKADLWVAFPGPNDPTVLPALSASQRLAVDSSIVAWRPLANARRTLVVNIPSEADTAGTGLTFADLSSARWNAMQSDYGRIATVGESLRRALAGGKRVRVTSPEGTDVSFSLAPNGVIVDAIPSLVSGRNRQPANIAVLPGGAVNAIIVESSANGKVRAAYDQCTLPVRDEAIDVNHGRAENIHAGSDEACVQKALTGLRLSMIGIGLNPALTSVRTPAGMPLETAGEGLVALYFGNNRYFGGTNADGPVWYVPLAKATVSADGKAIVRDGQLVDRR